MSVYCRLLLAIAVSAPIGARAETPDLSFCEGRYAAAADMLDAAYSKYGSLYSGGSHTRRLDDVGATVDLYRLWSGLPDLGLRDLHKNWRLELDYQEVSLGDVQHRESLEHALALADAPATAMSESERYRAVVRLDLATALDDPADWWLIEDLPLANDARRAVRELAATHAFLDWLQFATVISALPFDAWEQAAPSSYVRLARHAGARWREHGELSWLVLLAQLPIAVEEAGEVHRQVSALDQKVADCQASPGEYAAFAIIASQWREQDARPEHLTRLPPILRQQWVQHWAWSTPNESWGAPSARARAETLGVPELAPWLAVIAAYTAESEASLIDAHQGIAWMPKSLRVINLMPVNGLLRLARSPGINDTQRASVLRVAFARAFALGQDELAWRLLPELESAFPEQQSELAAIARLKMARQRQLALIALALPGISTGLHPDASTLYDGDYLLYLRHGGEYLDLPGEIALGHTLQADAEAFWQEPRRWHRYRGMRGYSLPAVERALDRPAGLASRRHAPNVLGDDIGGHFSKVRPMPGINDWAAWEELAAISGGSRLSVRLTRELVDCADHPGRRWLRRDDCRSERVAEALSKLVRINRAQPIAPIDGKPAGQIAFQALHRNFPESRWAMATPYWYE